VPVPAEASSTSRRFTFADGIGEIGFINPVSQPFCGTCNRIRLTADGQIRTCLFSIDEWDLRAPLRSGASDDDLADILILFERSELRPPERFYTLEEAADELAIDRRDVGLE